MMFSRGKIPVSNIFRCFLAEKYLMLKFSDVFSGKNVCFQYFLMFSCGKIPDAKIFRCFLREKCMFPIFFDVFLQQNPKTKK